LINKKNVKDNIPIMQCLKLVFPYIDNLYVFHQLSFCNKYLYNVSKNCCNPNFYDYKKIKNSNKQNVYKLIISDIEQIKNYPQVQAIKIIHAKEKVIIDNLNDNITFIDSIHERKIQIINLPNKLKKLCITSSELIHNIELPPNLETLICYDFDNKKIKINFPKNLIKLVCKSCKFENFDISFLPNSLKYLDLGYSFNQPINNLQHQNGAIEHICALPPNITHLILGENFNQPITKLPNTLTHLIFGKKYLNYKYNYTKCNFNQNINGILPNSLKCLVLGSSFNQEIFKLPPNLKYLVLGGYNHETKKDLLPKSLKYLTFGYEFNKVLVPGILPESLELLKFDTPYNEKINKNVLPQSLKKLYFGNHFSQDLEGVLSNDLQEIILGSFYNHSINNFPDSLKHMRLDSFYGKEIEKLPENLEHLVLGSFYNNRISFNSKLKILEIGSSMLKTLHHDLPKSLNRIVVTNYKGSINDIPKHCQKLIYFK